MAFAQRDPTSTSVALINAAGSCGERGDANSHKTAGSFFRNYVVVQCNSCGSCKTSWVPPEETCERLCRLLGAASARLDQLKQQQVELEELASGLKCMVVEAEEQLTKPRIKLEPLVATHNVVDTGKPQAFSDELETAGGAALAAQSPQDDGVHDEEGKENARLPLSCDHKPQWHRVQQEQEVAKEETPAGVGEGPFGCEAPGRKATHGQQLSSHAVRNQPEHYSLSSDEGANETEDDGDDLFGEGHGDEAIAAATAAARPSLIDHHPCKAQEHAAGDSYHPQADVAQAAAKPADPGNNVALQHASARFRRVDNVTEAEHAANVRWLQRQGYDGHDAEDAESKARHLELTDNLDESDMLLKKLMVTQRHQLGAA